MSHLVTLMALLIATSVNAAEPLWLNIGGASWHPGAHGLNGRNPGIGLELGLDHRRFIAGGAYRNSNNDISHYAVHGWRPYDSGAVSGGIIAGAIDGYDIRDGGVFPFAAPYMSIEGKTAAMSIIVIPRVEKRVATTIAVQLKFRIQ